MLYWWRTHHGFHEIIIEGRSADGNPKTFDSVTRSNLTQIDIVGETGVLASRNCSVGDRVIGRRKRTMTQILANVVEAASSPILVGSFGIAEEFVAAPKTEATFTE